MLELAHVQLSRAILYYFSYPFFCKSYTAAFCCWPTSELFVLLDGFSSISIFLLVLSHHDHRLLNIYDILEYVIYSKKWFAMLWSFWSALMSTFTLAISPKSILVPLLLVVLWSGACTTFDGWDAYFKLKYVQNNADRELLSFGFTVVNLFNILTTVRTKLNSSLPSLFWINFKRLWRIEKAKHSNILYSM